MASMAMGYINYLTAKKGPTGFSSASTAEQVTEGVDLTGKVAIVTGGGSGLGQETARVLTLRGAHVFIAVRREEAAAKVKEEILASDPNAKLDILCLDLSSFKSVHAAVESFTALNLPLHIIINNAGVMACPFALTPDGHEVQFATNHLGHFLLNTLLVDKMKKTAQECGEVSRIVVVSSDAHRFTYTGGIRLDKIDDPANYSEWRAYGQSKLATILYGKEFARRLQAEGGLVTVNVLHPGGIRTPLQRHMSGPLLNIVYFTTGALWKSIPQGAATSCLLAASPTVKGITGKYFVDCNEAQGSNLTNDMDLAARLWDYSVRTVAAGAQGQAIVSSSQVGMTVC